jgi:hypothetical protein
VETGLLAKEDLNQPTDYLVQKSSLLKVVVKLSHKQRKYVFNLQINNTVQGKERKALLKAVVSCFSHT